MHDDPRPLIGSLWSVRALKGVVEGATRRRGGATTAQQRGPQQPDHKTLCSPATKRSLLFSCYHSSFRVCAGRVLDGRLELGVPPCTWRGAFVFERGHLLFSA